MRCAKKDERIEVLFGVKTLADPRRCVGQESRDSLMASGVVEILPTVK